MHLATPFGVGCSFFLVRFCDAHQAYCLCTQQFKWSGKIVLHLNFENLHPSLVFMHARCCFSSPPPSFRGYCYAATVISLCSRHLGNFWHCLPTPHHRKWLCSLWYEKWVHVRVYLIRSWYHTYGLIIRMSYKDYHQSV